MTGTRSTLEVVLETEICRVAWTRQVALKQKASGGATPSSCKDLESCRRQLGRVAEVHGQRSVFLEQVAGWRQLAQHQSAQVPDDFPDWS
jgi:hypothetical protein